LLPQGLAHSAWLQNSLRRFGSPLRVRDLKTHEGWRALSAENALEVYATMDVEFPTELTLGPAAGMVVPVFHRPGESFREPSGLIWNFLAMRGEYRYGRRPDFFTSDLIGEYSTAHQRLGSSLVHAGRASEARRHLNASWAMKWRVPETATFLAYLDFRSGRLDRALSSYTLAEGLYDETLGLMKRYHTLPDMEGSIRTAAADTTVNLGVVYEKMGDKANAEAMYRKAIRTDPKKAQAYYNIGVLYWRNDWDKAIEAFESALRINPRHTEAAKFLQAARRMRN
jgi:tetratricopeptide (TPR) repeat protein